MRRMTDPDQSSLCALKRMARFLKWKPRCVARFAWGGNPREVVTFGDANFAACPRTSRSTCGWGHPLGRETHQGMVSHHQRSLFVVRRERARSHFPIRQRIPRHSFNLDGSPLRGGYHHPHRCLRCHWYVTKAWIGASETPRGGRALDATAVARGSIRAEAGRGGAHHFSEHLTKSVGGDLLAQQMDACGFEAREGRSSTAPRRTRAGGP